MSDIDPADISKKLDTLIRLQALELVRGEPTEQAKIALLDTLGFSTREIAKMLGKSPENIGVVLSRLKKGRVPNGGPKQENEGIRPLDAT